MFLANQIKSFLQIDKLQPFLNRRFTSQFVGKLAPAWNIVLQRT